MIYRSASVFVKIIFTSSQDKQILIELNLNTPSLIRKFWSDSECELHLVVHGINVISEQNQILMESFLEN